MRSSRIERGGDGSSRIGIDAWFTEMDRFSGVPFMEEGRNQPPMPCAWRLPDLGELREKRSAGKKKPSRRG
jgi:hypothetical protein